MLAEVQKACDDDITPRLEELRQQKQVTGDGSTLAAERERVKREHEKEQQDIMQALESESEKKKEVLMSSFAAKKAKAKNDMDIAGTFSQAEIDGALQAIDEEIACALNLLEMDSLQALEDAPEVFSDEPYTGIGGKPGGVIGMLEVGGL